MPTPTYTPLATVTLASSASSVTFSSIPATYRDLVIVFSGKNDLANGASLTLRFNGDTGSNYSYVTMYGDGSTTGSGSGTGTFTISGLSGLTNVSNSFIQIMDYSATDKHKTVISRGNDTGSYTEAHASRWASTSAITSIVVGFTGARNYTAASTFSLYAIAA